MRKKLEIFLLVLLLVLSMLFLAIPVRAEVGIASYYWQPQRVASGGMFNPNAMTAAHKTLRFGTKVRVTNLKNKKSVIVVINDRGPFTRGRIIDLSKAAAQKIDMIKNGLVKVKLEIIK